MNHKQFLELLEAKIRVAKRMTSICLDSDNIQISTLELYFQDYKFYQKVKELVYSHEQ
jgi:hypothetical protein